MSRGMKILIALLAVALLAGYGIHAWPAGRVAPATGRPGAVELVGQHPGW